MLLIISCNETDTETDLVCQILAFQKVPFLRLNMDDFLRQEACVTEQYFQIHGQQFRYQDFELVWVRRKINGFNSGFQDKAFDQSSNAGVNIFHASEWELFCKFFFSQFPAERMVNQASGYFQDKIDQLVLARKIGLPTAESLFANRAQSLAAFPPASLIAKPAGNLGYLRRNGIPTKAYTQVVDPALLPPAFLPSFFQEKLNAEYEIRSLYLDGQFFHCGMLKPLQRDHPVDVKQQAEIRCQPVRVDPVFEALLHRFMQELGFRVGFIDVLKTEQGYRFLEMNPIGKFLYYSYSCAFQFEHHLAQFLIREAEKRQGVRMHEKGKMNQGGRKGQDTWTNRELAKGQEAGKREKVQQNQYVEENNEGKQHLGEERSPDSGEFVDLAQNVTTKPINGAVPARNGSKILKSKPTQEPEHNKTARQQQGPGNTRTIPKTPVAEKNQPLTALTLHLLEDQNPEENHELRYQSAVYPSQKYNNRRYTVYRTLKKL